MKFCCVGQRRRGRRRRRCRRRCGRLRRLRVGAPLPCRATRRAQTETSESERGESREELYELFVLQLVFVRRVASRLLSAKPRSRRLHVGSALLWCRCLCVALAQLWHLPDVLLLL